MSTNNKKKDSAALFELIGKSTLKVPKGGSLKIPSWYSAKTNPVPPSAAGTAADGTTPAAAPVSVPRPMTAPREVEAPVRVPTSGGPQRAGILGSGGHGPLVQRKFSPQMIIAAVAVVAIILLTIILMNMGKKSPVPNTGTAGSGAGAGGGGGAMTNTKSNGTGGGNKVVVVPPPNDLANGAARAYSQEEMVWKPELYYIVVATYAADKEKLAISARDYLVKNGISMVLSANNTKHMPTLITYQGFPDSKAAEEMLKKIKELGKTFPDKKKGDQVWLDAYTRQGSKFLPPKANG